MAARVDLISWSVELGTPGASPRMRTEIAGNDGRISRSGTDRRRTGSPSAPSNHAGESGVRDRFYISGRTRFPITDSILLDCGRLRNPPNLPPWRRFADDLSAARQSVSLDDCAGIIAKQNLRGVSAVARQYGGICGVQTRGPVGNVMGVAGDHMDQASLQQARAGGLGGAPEAA